MNEHLDLNKYQDKKLFVFDLYGTCIYYDKNLLELKKILSLISKNTISELRKILQTRPINIEDAWFDIPDKFIKDINNLIQKNIESSGIYTDTLDTLEYLREKWYKLALISNLSKEYEKPLRDLIPAWTFDYEALSFNVWEMKPNSWIFNHIKDKSWIDFKDMVMVWDNLDLDIKWAQNVWMDWILVDRKTEWINYCKKNNIVIVNTLSCLKDIFKNQITY